jgi:hypothetical protein
MTSVQETHELHDAYASHVFGGSAGIVMTCEHASERVPEGFAKETGFSWPEADPLAARHALGLRPRRRGHRARARARGRRTARVCPLLAPARRSEPAHHVRHSLPRRGRGPDHHDEPRPLGPREASAHGPALRAVPCRGGSRGRCERARRHRVRGAHVHERVRGAAALARGRHPLRPRGRARRARDRGAAPRGLRRRGQRAVERQGRPHPRRLAPRRPHGKRALELEVRQDLAESAAFRARLVPVLAELLH